MSGRCFQVGKPGISPREFTAHTEMSQPFVWYGVGAQIRIGLPSKLLSREDKNVGAERQSLRLASPPKLASCSWLLYSKYNMKVRNARQPKLIVG